MIPHTPLTMPDRGDLTSDSQLYVIIDEVIANGGSTILSYGLEVDYGVGFVPVAGDPVD